MHFFNSLKANIAVSIAVLLLLSMLFIDFIMVVTAQKSFVNGQLAAGRLFASLVNMHIENVPDTSSVGLENDFHQDIDDLLAGFDVSNALVVDNYGKALYQSDFKSDNVKKLERLIRASIKGNRESVHLTGSTWGVFWRQRQTLFMAMPLQLDGRVVAGVGFVLKLDHFYNELRDSQQLVMFYIVLNTLILTGIGFYRIYRISIKPIHRLVKRASEYNDGGGFVFRYEKENNEFGQLSHALNSMLVRIADDREALQASLESLEKTNFQLNKARNEVIRAEKLASVGRLSAGIAHEIGNPIGIVLGYLELLRADNVTDEEKKDIIHRAESEIGRINVIIRQLLDFSRPAIEQIKHVSVHEIISEVIDILRVQPLMNNINVNTYFEAEDDRIYADPNRLRQVFLNLMINACDAISSGDNKDAGAIEIKTKIIVKDGQPDKMKIEFVDNGPGILPDDHVSIFDPFYTTKAPGKGTGLGLSVSFMIVEQIGGTIKVGDAGDIGTNMVVCLPYGNVQHGE